MLLQQLKLTKGETIYRVGENISKVLIQHIINIQDK